VMEQAVEKRGDATGVGKDLAPILEGCVSSKLREAADSSN
jgi:hypothetical protein